MVSELVVFVHLYFVLVESGMLHDVYISILHCCIIIIIILCVPYY